MAGKRSRARVVAHHGLVAQALDERPRDRRRDGRDEVHPVRRQGRREHRHRLQVPPEAARSRVPEHHLAVREHVGAADLDDATGALGHVERRDQVAQQVVDGDGLHARVHPLRADHHRQALGEVADHLERDAARADHDRGAELGDGDPGLAQRLAGLLARAKVTRQVGRGVAQAAEVDDASDAGRGRGAAEGPRRGQVALAIALAPGHGVHEVVGHADAGQRRPERLGAQHVAGDDLDATGPVAALEALRVAHEHAHAPAGLEQARHQPAADVAGRAGDEYERVASCESGHGPSPGRPPEVAAAPRRYPGGRHRRRASCR